MNALVTVIIPSYNHSQFIEKAIESVLTQTYANLELIVVDDGSTDGTRDLLRGKLFDSRVFFILNENNRGQSAVLNQALSIARGDFICLLPSDDWFLPNKLSQQVEKFNQSDREVGIVYGRGYRYYTDLDRTVSVDLPLYRGWILEKLVREGNFIYPVTPMFRRECFEFARPDESYKAEGEAIYLKMAIKYQFDYVDDYVGTMRDHSYNTGKISEMMYRDNVRYWREFFDRTDLPVDVRSLKKFPLARVHRIKGLEAIALDKRYSDGRSALMQAIALRPDFIFDGKVIMGLFLSCLPKFFANAILQRFSGK